jgi:hypothetical protein
MVMAALEFTVDFDSILAAHQSDIQELSKDLSEAVAGLAAQTHAHVVEMANEKLHSRREAYVKALRFEEVQPGLWVITVPSETMWIEEGMEAHNMLDDLLKSPKAKMSADGSKYLVIPFKHDKGPTQQTDHARGVTQMLKQELKKRGVPYKKIEKGSDGKPKLGLIHSLNLGGEKRAHWTSPILNGVRIYQHMSKGGGQSVSRSVMTFRIASSKQAGTGKWDHPGTAGAKLLDEAFTWCQQEWETVVLPAVLAKYG